MENQFKGQTVSNFFAINAHGSTENGNYRVTGLLSTFNDTESNANGYVYKSGCYDNFLKDYYQKNGKNITVDLLHNINDISHLAGKVVEFTANETEATIVVEISKHAVLFDKIVGLIEDGVLQGFSDMSYVDDGKLLDNGLLEVNHCSLISIALVPIPAVGKSSITASNATKFTFEKEEKKINTLFGL